MKVARLIVVAIGLVLATTGSAEAATWCVPNNSPGGCDQTRTTISAAVFSPGINNGDTVKIAPGNYQGTGDTTIYKRLHFVGAGAGTAASFDPATQTQINATPNYPRDEPALNLWGGGSLRSLELRAGGCNCSPGPEALVLDGDDGATLSFELSGVVLRAGSSIGSGGLILRVGTGTTTPKISLNVIGSTFKMGRDVVTGIAASATADVDLQISGTSFIGEDNNVYGAAIGLDGDAATITDSKVEGGADGIVAKRSALTVRRSDVSGSYQGISFESDIATPLPFEITDSLIHATASNSNTDEYAAVRAAITQVGQVNLVVRGSTIVARGSSARAAVLAEKPVGDPGSASADLRNTLARVESSSNSGSADLIGERAAVVADFSALSSSLATGGGSVPAPASASNIAGDPGMANTVGGDFSLLANSPLVDRGDASVVAAGQLDLPGSPRSLDGNEDCQARPDIGAFELTGHAAACPQNPGDPPVVPPGTPPNGAPVVSALSMSRKVFAPLAATAAAKTKAKRGTRFLYTLSEPATVAIAIERARKGRKVGKKCRKPTRTNRRRPKCTRYKRAGILQATQVAGKQSTPFSGRIRRKALPAGRYRARVTAVDALGARSVERRVSFRIVKP